MDPALKTLAKYASQRLLSYLERSPQVPDEPVAMSFPAAVLFADMQNFTVLAERLTREDPRLGVQKLAAYLDIYIGRLVDIITECGGDIVKFAGDACFAIWPAQDHGDGNSADLVRAIRLAANCGLQIQNQLHNYRVDDDVTLALRVGVSAGRLHELHLGGYLERWEQLFAGRAMGESGQAGTRAQPGQVVLGPRAVRELEKHGAGQRLNGAGTASDANSGRYRIPALPPEQAAGPLERSIIPANAREAFNVYVPRAILVGDATGMRAELRPVTVLFCKVKDVEFTAQTPAAVIQIIMLVMQECVYRYEGSLNRFGVDEKGAILLAAFGLPPLVHADDAIRGVRAALDIRRSLAVVGYDSAIGVATGRAFCGTVGNDTRCEYTMHGTNVNLAARLMVNAETILCDENTQRKAEKEFAFEQQPPLSVKGRDDAVQTYKPIV
ncbi:MAG: adenylate/guanylate cyclase domain-containing protein [bacterium]|nr:adenylate/guanylate cyclase domain-containing protein [bacterium]